MILNQSELDQYEPFLELTEKEKKDVRELLAIMPNTDIDKIIEIVLQSFNDLIRENVEK